MRRALILGLVLAACGPTTGGVDVDHARIGEPAGPNAALYFTASGSPDSLVAATTDVATAIQIHSTVANDDGSMGMEQLDSLELPEGEALVLEPGGHHLMLVGVDRLEVGDMVEVTLTWEQAGGMTIEAEVVSPADTLSDD